MTETTRCPECGAEGHIDYMVPVLSVHPPVYTFFCESEHLWSASLEESR